MPDYQVRWHDEGGRAHIGRDLPLSRVMDEQWDIVEMTGTPMPVEWNRYVGRTYTATPSITAATANPTPVWTIRSSDVGAWYEGGGLRRMEPLTQEDPRLWVPLATYQLVASEWVELRGQMHPREEAPRLAREEAERARLQREEEERRRLEENQRRQREHAEKLERRDARARELLEKFLNDEQVAMLNEESYFEVEAEDGHVFRIREGKVGNIRCIDGPRYTGREFCIHDTDYLPNLDCMLLQKVMIESDYDSFMRIANY